VGGFFMLNFVLAVVNENFEKQRDLLEMEAAQRAFDSLDADHRLGARRGEPAAERERGREGECILLPGAADTGEASAPSGSLGGRGGGGGGGKRYIGGAESHWRPRVSATRTATP
jgi:hypothetical protein